MLKYSAAPAVVSHTFPGTLSGCWQRSRTGRERCLHPSCPVLSPPAAGRVCSCGNEPRPGRSWKTPLGCASGAGLRLLWGIPPSEHTPVRRGCARMLPVAFCWGGHGMEGPSPPFPWARGVAGRCLAGGRGSWWLGLVGDPWLLQSPLWEPGESLIMGTRTAGR